MPTTTVLEIGVRLRAVRKSRGMSLNDVADESGDYFKASCLGAYERGERVIPVDRFMELLAFYDTSPWRFLSGLPV